MLNATSMRFIFGFLVLIAVSLMLVIGIAYYEESESIKKEMAGNHCAPGMQC